MKKLLTLFLFAAVLAAPLAFSPLTGCKSSELTLEPGGAYSDPVLAKTDRAILDASRTMGAFVEWANTNATYLQRFPDIVALAKTVAEQRDKWIRDAYSARDAYASASHAYRSGSAGAVEPKRAALDGAIAVLSNVTTQITNYQNAHRR